MKFLQPQDGCWYGYSDRCSRSFSEAETMVAGQRVARACGPGVLLQEPTDYVKVPAGGMGAALVLVKRYPFLEPYTLW